MPKLKNDPAVFAENIKLFRSSVKLSQKDLAELAEVTQSNVSQWESGACTPPVKVLQLIKNLYPKVNTDWFFTEPKPSKNFFENKYQAELSEIKQAFEKLTKEIVGYRKLVKTMEEEINRLREQNDVLTQVAKRKMLKG